MGVTLLIALGLLASTAFREELTASDAALEPTS